MTDQDTEAHIIMFRRVECRNCKRYRALEHYIAQSKKPGTLQTLCTCAGESDIEKKTDDECVAFALEKLAETFGDLPPYLDEDMN